MAIFETLLAIFEKKALATLELHLSAVFVWSGSTKFVLDRDCCVCSNLTLVAISREGEVAGFSRSVIIFFWNKKDCKVLAKKTWNFELELFFKTRRKISSFSWRQKKYFWVVSFDDSNSPIFAIPVVKFLNGSPKVSVYCPICDFASTSDVYLLFTSTYKPWF